MIDFNNYLSPFSWRYGSTEMRKIWSEVYKRRLWRRIWISLASVQAEFDLVRPEQVNDLLAHQKDVDMQQALEVEAEIHHDLMAELKVFAKQCPVGGGALHLGATSMDVEDNATALQIRESLDIILVKLGKLLENLAGKILKWADHPVMAYTHLQPAEPTTLGFRLAQYAQDLFADWENIGSIRSQVRGKGFTGAVGTGASYADLIGMERLDDFEKRLSIVLDLPFYPITTQTYPRKQEYQVVSALSSLGASLYKFAFDLRVLQSPSIGEVSEPFTSNQVGSSAMPFKRNPINAEKIDSLGRVLAQMPRLAWDNAAHSLLERTLDDSANRRSFLPESFLITDELLITGLRILDGLQIDEIALQRNLSNYGQFAALERVLMALSKAGADRQAMHEGMRRLAMQAWETIKSGEDNPIIDMICQEPDFLNYLDEKEIRNLMEVSQYTGNAAQRARRLAEKILEMVSS
jgi:adenylosuccinate lyase